MRLSTAIMLGRHLVEPRAEDISRCALGMGLASCGAESFDYVTLHKQWPWLFNPPPLEPVCGCGRGVCYTPQMSLAIGHIFDAHVMGIYRDWTLEQLVDWIRSVEPVEPQEFSEAVEVLAGEAVSK